MHSSENYVVLLGTKGGPAIRPGSSMPTSNLLVLNNKPIVVDCGLGVTRGLVNQGIELKNISLIFITHLHSDHYLELGPLLHTAWTAGLKTPVDVYGPPGLQRYWDGFLNSMKDDIELRQDDEGRPILSSLIHFHEIDAGTVMTQDGMSVNAMRTIHPPLVDCFALSFKTDNTHIVFSGDTARLEALEDFAQGADLLIHEAMLEAALPALMKRIGNGSEKLMQHMLRSHTFAHDAAQTATNAGVKRLALAHLVPADDPEYNEKHWLAAVKDHWTGEVFIGKDGLRINLTN